MFLKLTSNLARHSRLWRTLAFKLTAGYALAGLLLVTFAVISLYLVLVSELDKSTDFFLADKVHVLQTMLRERPGDEDALREEVELESAARRYEHFYICLRDDRNNSVLITPGMTHQLKLAELAEQTQNHPDRTIGMTGTDGTAFRVTSALAPVGLPATRTDTLLIAIDVSQKEELLARYRLWFWLILLASAVMFPVVGYQVARHGIRPVEQMATTARHISSTNLRERILPEGYPFELATLAGTFNQMLDRLEESFEQISRFSADIAHDLRTPVNNIRGEAEVALARARTSGEYRDVIESCLEEAVRLSDLIGDLLFLARAESPISHLRRERVDVGEVLSCVREYYEALAADVEVSLLTVDVGAPIVADLDRTLLQRAVGNLVTNALAHTPPGGTVILNAVGDSSTIHIEVSDTGIGIPAEALPKVFDRFFRVDSARSHEAGGTGLGLAIVKSIVQLHGGKVKIVSQPGQGTRVTLECPVFDKDRSLAESSNT